MSDRVRAAAGRVAPWRRGVAWQVVLVQGLVTLGLGLWMLLRPEQVREVVVPLVGWYLVVMSALLLVGVLRAQRPDPAMPYLLLRGGTGFVVGLLVVLQPIVGYADRSVARWILAFGLLVVGLIAVAQAALVSADRRGRLGALILGAVFLALSWLFFSGEQTSETVRTVVGLVATGLGVILLVYAVGLSRRGHPTEAGQAGGTGTSRPV